EAREKVARALRVRATDVVFTSGGTESNNLAINGTIKNLRAAGVKNEDIEIISTTVEHPSVTKVLVGLQKSGVAVTYLKVDEDGLVLFDEFKQALSAKTRLVTIGYANSETGVVQDLNKLAREVKAFEKENGLSIVFHTDASQAPMWL